MKKKKTITLSDQNSNEILYQGEDLEEAYKLAKTYEDWGLEVKMETPTVLETLLDELGASKEEKISYFESTQEELDHHV